MQFFAHQHQLKSAGTLYCPFTVYCIYVFSVVYSLYMMHCSTHTACAVSCVCSVESSGPGIETDLGNPLYADYTARVWDTHSNHNNSHKWHNSNDSNNL